MTNYNLKCLASALMMGERVVISYWSKSLAENRVGVFLMKHYHTIDDSDLHGAQRLWNHFTQREDLIYWNSIQKWEVLQSDYHCTPYEFERKFENGLRKGDVGIPHIDNVEPREIISDVHFTDADVNPEYLADDAVETSDWYEGEEHKIIQPEELHITVKKGGTCVIHYHQCKCGGKCG